MKRLVTVLVFVPMLVSLLVVAAPSLANNDPTVPADECSDNPKVVGQPFGTNAVDIGPAPIAGPASLFNAADSAQGFPGQAQADGANGQANSQAIAHCD